MTTTPTVSHAEAAFQRALVLHQQSRLDDARVLYENVLALQPNHCQAAIFLSVLAIESGQPERALELMADATRLEPHNTAAHLVHGHALFQLRRYEAAIASYDRAILSKFDSADAYFYRGNALREAGRDLAALASYDRAISIMPNYAEAHNNRGSVLREMKQSEAAILSFDRAIAINCNFSPAYFNRGLVQSELGRYESALASYDRAIETNPQFAEAHCNRGNVLVELKNPRAALASYDRAIAERAGYAVAYCNRGNALSEIHEFEAALASFDRAISIDPGYAEAYSNRGNMLCDLRRLDEALASLNDAIALSADYAQAYFSRSFVLLLRGDLENGWRDYEWRWKVRDTLTFQERREFTQPRWDGKQPIAGRTILLHREQGLGDALQFSRYVTLLAQLGATVILEIHKPLMSLFATLAGVSQLIERGTPLPDFDYWCPLLSLPLAFNTTLGDIPAATRYLAGDPAKVVRWRARLGDRAKPRIGLVWSGGSVHPNDHNRSIRFAQLMEHLPQGLRYVSLQKDVRERDRQSIAKMPDFLNPETELDDFSDTAALCECVDLVISVDTSVAHLSAALGRKTWILLPFSPDWRWLLNREDSPWYPTVKLYRQMKVGDWHGVLSQVRSDLVREFQLG